MHHELSFAFMSLTRRQCSLACIQKRLICKDSRLSVSFQKTWIENRSGEEFPCLDLKNIRRE